MGVEHPHAVGADHPNPGGAHVLRQFPLHLRARRSDFPKSCRNDHQATDTTLDAFASHRKDMRLGDHDDGQVGGFRQRGDRGKGGDGTN